MQQRQIASLSVSAIGLGCMNVSYGYGPADDAQSARLLHAALDAGINFLDTAFTYGAGHSETLIGKTLRSERQRFVLASKCGLSPEGIDAHPDTIRRQCETSLQRLQSEVIDLYYLHRVDPCVPVEESVGTMAELVAEGKVREIGLSEVCCETLRRAHALHPIAAVQSEYSLWSRTPEYGMLSLCQEIGATLVPFSPLGRGFLAGTARDVTGLDEQDLRMTIARPRFEVDAFRRNAMLLDDFAQLAREAGGTMAQLALAWLLAQQAGSLVPIPGTRSIEHMQENLAAVDLSPEPDILDRLDRLINESTVIGTRYTADRMASTDSERDRLNQA